MKVESISVKKFAAFADAQLSFVPGINVFIGENGMGKSHLMKLMYAILKVQGTSSMKKAIAQVQSKQTCDREMYEKIARVFKPDDDQVGRLVRRKVGRNKATVELATVTKGKTTFEFTSTNNLSCKQQLQSVAGFKPIFIPSREALAMYEGFIHAYQERELAFDETYYDLCMSLSANPLRGPRATQVAALSEPLEKIIGGRVVLEGGRFYVKSFHGEGNLEAHLLAEGFRKLASLLRLISNGELPAGGVLFWDEPEANLNPTLVRAVVGLLRQLAAKGVQVFVATHDFLLSNELSLDAEYRKGKQAPSIRFFALYREREKDGTQVESADSLAAIANNAILREFAAHYDREEQLARAELAQKKE